MRVLINDTRRSHLRATRSQISIQSELSLESLSPELEEADFQAAQINTAADK
jgi:hypothetical protein